MTTTDIKVLHNRADAADRATRGYQAPLIITEAPAGAVALLGTPLQGKTLTVAGDYVCLIPLSGLAANLTCHLNATLSSGTASSSGPDQLVDFNPRLTDVATAAVLTAGTGDGSLTTDVTQVSSVALTGALYARLTLAIAGGTPSVIVNRAEAVGL